MIYISIYCNNLKEGDTKTDRKKLQSFIVDSVIFFYYRNYSDNDLANPQIG